MLVLTILMNQSALAALNGSAELNIYHLLDTYNDSDNRHATGTITLGTDTSRNELAIPFAFLGVDYGIFLNHPDPVANNNLGILNFGPSENAGHHFMNIELLKIGYKFY